MNAAIGHPPTGGLYTLWRAGGNVTTYSSLEITEFIEDAHFAAESEFRSDLELRSQRSLARSYRSATKGEISLTDPEAWLPAFSKHATSIFDSVAGKLRPRFSDLDEFEKCLKDVMMPVVELVLAAWEGRNNIEGPEVKACAPSDYRLLLRFPYVRNRLKNPLLRELFSRSRHLADLHRTVDACLVAMHPATVGTAENVEETRHAGPGEKGTSSRSCANRLSGHGARLRELRLARTEAPRSRGEVAKRFHISLESVKKHEEGKVMPRPPVRKLYADLHGLSEIEIFGSVIEITR